MSTEFHCKTCSGPLEDKTCWDKTCPDGEIEKLRAICAGIDLEYLQDKGMSCEHWPIEGNMCWCSLVRRAQDG